MKSSAVVGCQSLTLAALGILAISAVSPLMARAQTVEGRIVDEMGELPLRVATVSLLRVDEGVVVSTTSDSLGNYRISVPEPGDYQVVADALGYQRLQTPLLALDEERSYDVDFELPSDPIELEGFDVEVEGLEKMRRELRMYGVLLDALGERFVGAQDIARRETARDFGSILQWQNIPGLRVIRSDDLVPQPARPFVCVRIVAGRGSCAMFVLNGAMVTRETAYMIPAESLEAIAVLTPQEATTLYGTGADGGAVLLFTR